jgi:RNA polymerase sigma-70 factor, ECF subfamily
MLARRGARAHTDERPFLVELSLLSPALCRLTPIALGPVDVDDWCMVRLALDIESLGWLRALSGTGPEHEDAVERLHALLLRAARFELSRRRRGVAGGGFGDLDDLAVEAADDALVAILRKLHTYRGASSFTTWAYKFVVLEAAVRLRSRPWLGRELPLETDGWAQLSDDGRPSPAGQAEASEFFDAVRGAIAEVLTPHQRSVLVAITLNDVPIDMLAERLGTTRGALYKTLHDARRKLRARLAQDGLALDSPRARDGGGTRSAADRSEAADDRTVGDVGEQGGGRGGAAVVA